MSPSYGPLASYPISAPDDTSASFVASVACPIGTSWAAGSWNDAAWKCLSWAGVAEVVVPDVDVVSGPIGLGRRAFAPASVVRLAPIHGTVRVDLPDLAFFSHGFVTSAATTGQVALVLEPFVMEFHGTMTPAGTRGRVALSGEALDVYVALRLPATQKGH